MRIEQRVPCPRCGHARVVQRSMDSFVCFQCGNSWFKGPTTVDPLGWCGPEQRARLVAYRDAVRAGVYTDWPRR
jgi:hypothetical protein